MSEKVGMIGPAGWWGRSIWERSPVDIITDSSKEKKANLNSDYDQVMEIFVSKKLIRISLYFYHHFA